MESWVAKIHRGALQALLHYNDIKMNLRANRLYLFISNDIGASQNVQEKKSTPTRRHLFVRSSLLKSQKSLKYRQQEVLENTNLQGAHFPVAQLQHHREDSCSQKGFPHPWGQQLGKGSSALQPHGPKNQNKHKWGSSIQAHNQIPSHP